MQVCLVGRKGSDPPGMRGGVGHDVIYSERRGQSQKPEEIYQLIEQLAPHGEQICNGIITHFVTTLLLMGKAMVLAI
jgi:N6-adenosine-specific RNA methylase IME4